MPNNTVWSTGYRNVVNAWNQFQNVMTGPEGTYSDCSISLGNNRSEVARVPVSALGNARALTKKVFSNVCNYSATSIVEVDIWLGDDLNFHLADESMFNMTQTDFGRAILVHEFGHALGLGHEHTRLNQMGISALKPLTGSRLTAPGVGGESAAPFPDDALGTMSIYNYQPVQQNVFVSAARLRSDGVVDGMDVDGEITVCRGSVVDVTFTIGNATTTVYNGKGFRIFINPTLGSTVGSHLLFDGWFSIGASMDFTSTLKLTIPSTAPNGLYFLSWQADPANQLIEWSKTDNFTHSRMMIRVAC